MIASLQKSCWRLFLSLLICSLLSSCYRREESGALFLKQRRAVATTRESGPRCVIVLDAGHGGKDEGCVSKISDCEEKELALNVTHLVQKKLHEMGYVALLTRNADIFLSLDERVELANEMNADLFVSVHFNHAANAKAKGIEVYYCGDKKSQERCSASKDFAETLLSKVLLTTEAKSRGVKTANFRVIKETVMPAVLVEGGFLSNTEEKNLCKKASYQEALALGIAKGIDEYAKMRPRRDSNARPAA